MFKKNYYGFCEIIVKESVVKKSFREEVVFKLNLKDEEDFEE